MALIKLKATPEDCATHRLLNSMTESWKNWLFPEYKFRIPITGFVHIVKEKTSDLTEDDFVDFSADDFYISTTGQVSATINFYGKINKAKLTGQFDGKYDDKYQADFNLEWIDGTEEASKLGTKLNYDLSAFTGNTSMVATLSARQLGYSKPEINGSF